MLGAREDGTTELLARELGARQSTESWGGVLRDLRKRGLRAPLLAMGDGALGLWAARREVFPTTAYQRWENHRALNVLDALPQRLWPQARRLAAIAQAEARAECERLRDASVAELRAQGQARAVETLRDWDASVKTRYDLSWDIRCSSPSPTCSPARKSTTTSPLHNSTPTCALAPRSAPCNNSKPWGSM